MFFLNTKLHKSKNLILSLKTLHSYGAYRRKFLYWLFNYSKPAVNTTHLASTLVLLKFYIINVLSNLEMDLALISINIQLKKSLQTYQGLRLHLDLPVHGQRSRTNASTQRLLARIPRRRHFVQKKNRRKFAPKDHRWTYQKNKLDHAEKK
jgi:ribosomal protein S13